MSELPFVLTDEPIYTTSPTVTAQMFVVLRDVVRERERVDRKWGVQQHDPFAWLSILVEEVGEVAREVAESTARPLEEANYRAELVQVAGVAIAAIEALDFGASGLGRDREGDGR